MSWDLPGHVKGKLVEAEASIAKARRLLADPQPGLTTWMQFLAEDIEAARDALDAALVRPL